MPDIKEKLVELLKEADRYEFEEQKKNGDFSIEAGWKLIADHLIANGVTIQRWLSVEERLPEFRVPVLTYGRKGAIGIGFVQPTSVTEDGKVYFYPRYGDNLPTHWMPLPEPPKGE